MNATLPTAEALRAALAALLDGLPPTQAAQAVDRLIASYRGTTPTDAPILRDRSDVAAYAAYRMPATFEAVRSCLDALREAAPGWAPATHTDIGGGTGAASWAVAGAWDGTRTTVLDWSEPALALGRELAEASGIPGLRAATWERARIGTSPAPAPTDLVTVSYVLKELTAENRAVVVDAAAAAQAVVIVEPGTPDGYDRIIEARDRLIGAGLTVAAPCPHDDACPIERGHRLVPLLGPCQPLVPAPPGEGRLAQPRGREVQLRRGDAVPHRARHRTGHPQAADPQGTGAAGALHEGRGPATRHGHQAARPALPCRPGHRVGRRLAAARGRLTGAAGPGPPLSAVARPVRR
ncbi:hypothetical protein RKD45_001975 [Streptomyces griseus]